MPYTERVELVRAVAQVPLQAIYAVLRVTARAGCACCAHSLSAADAGVVGVGRRDDAGLSGSACAVQAAKKVVIESVSNSVLCYEASAMNRALASITRVLRGQGLKGTPGDAADGHVWLEVRGELGQARDLVVALAVCCFGCCDAMYWFLSNSKKK